MKDVTRIRRLTKLWVAWNDQTINTETALNSVCTLLHLKWSKLKVLTQLLGWDDCNLLIVLHEAHNKSEFNKAWNAYMRMTDLARERWLKEILKP